MMRTLPLLPFFPILPLLPPLPVPAFVAGAASPVTQSFQVSADIVTGCLVATAGGAAWGTIDLGTVAGIATGGPSGSLVSSIGSGLQIDCTPGTTATITADNGAHAIGGVRQLAHTGTPVQSIPYRLAVGAGGVAWTTQGFPIIYAPGTSRQTLPITATATLPGVQAAGAYADTVHVVLAW